MHESSLKPFWIGLVLMLAGVGLIYWSFSSHRRGAEDAAPIDSKIGDNDVVCVQVITPAKNPATGEVVDYPTPCDVPDGWEALDREMTE